MSWVEITTAIGTAGAAVVALLLGLKAEWRATRAEHRARLYHERRQAEHVAAWMLVEQDNGDGPKEIEPENSSGIDRFCVYQVVQNASDEPIWDVTVYSPTLVEQVRGSQNFLVLDTKNKIGFIGPHEERKSPITGMTLQYNRAPLMVEFRDNAGRNWSRDKVGRLHQGRESEPDPGLSGILWVLNVGKKGGNKAELRWGANDLAARGCGSAGAAHPSLARKRSLIRGRQVSAAAECSNHTDLRWLEQTESDC